MYFGIIAALAATFNSCGGGGDADLTGADSTGLPGDNFSLAGALDLFKESESLEEFEKNLNTKKNKVNNLDLNGDSTIDYIRVVDKVKDNAHAIVLQVPVSQDEVQDVAVIEILKSGKDMAVVQIIGNELLYGDSAIVEPQPDGEAKTAQASMMPGLMHETAVGMDVNVWLWPPVQHVYSPGYVVYASPVVYNAYPVWFEPWPPYPYGWYRRQMGPRHRGYYAVYDLRPNPAHFVYYPYRRNSALVMNRYQAVYMKHGMPKMKGKPYYGPGGPGFKDHGGKGPGGKGGPAKMEGGKGGGHIQMGPGGGNKGGSPHMGAPSGPKGGGGPAVKGGGGSKGPSGPSGGGKPSGGGGGGKGKK
jgi:hypothetical protein